MCLLATPAGFELGALPAGATIQTRLAGKAPLDVIVVFVTRAPTCRYVDVAARRSPRRGCGSRGRRSPRGSRPISTENDPRGRAADRPGRQQGVRDRRGVVGLRLVIRRENALARPREHRVEHRLGQPAGERVLLADVVAAEQRVGPRPRRRAVAEPGRGSPSWPSSRGAQHPVPCECAERDDRAQLVSALELAVEERQAAVALAGDGLLSGGAHGHRRDVSVGQRARPRTHRVGWFAKPPRWSAP